MLLDVLPRRGADVPLEEHPFAALPSGKRLTVSIGMAEHRVSDAMDATLSRADRALYTAKRTGRNPAVSAP